LLRPWFFTGVVGSKMSLTKRLRSEFCLLLSPPFWDVCRPQAAKNISSAASDSKVILFLINLGFLFLEEVSVIPAYLAYPDFPVNPVSPAN
jgi:hypothetical protein